MALVFQDYSRSLYPLDDRRRNVEFPLRRKPISRRERRQAVEQALASVGLDGLRRQVPVAALRRHAAARGDRPRARLPAGDPADGRAVRLGGRADPRRPRGPRAAIRQEYGVTIVFVTHDIDESVYIADRVVILSQRPPCAGDARGAAAASARPGGDEGAAGVRAPARARVPRDQAPRQRRPVAGMSERDAYATLHAAIVSGELAPGRAAGRGGAGRAARRAAAAPSARRSCGSATTGSSCASATAARACGGSRSARRSRSSRRAPRWSRSPPATPPLRRTDRRGARADAPSSPRWSGCTRAGELLAMSERNALMHRRILEISRPQRRARHLRAPALADGALPVPHRARARALVSSSLAEHRVIVDAIAAGDGGAAEAAMRRHLSNVAAVLSDIASE